MVFSANSRNSAGTSSFGSIMPSSSGLNGALPHFQNGVLALFAPSGFSITNLFRGIQRSSSGCTQTPGAVSCLLPPLARAYQSLIKVKVLHSRWLGSLLAGSDLHFDQGHRLQCPGVTFALLRTPKNALRDVSHARRTHRMR